ncbi:hypothetical protein BH11PSE4_BH11PSE4_23270 [soil metagenome]
MTANDFQILIAPVIGAVAVAATGWISAILAVRRWRRLSRAAGAGTTTTRAAQATANQQITSQQPPLATKAPANSI